MNVKHIKNDTNLFKKFFRRHKNNLLIFTVLFLISFLLFNGILDFAFTTGDYTTLWTPVFNPESLYLYWSHPSVVLELFVLHKFFGANHLVFNLFGIFLRSLSAFVGFLLVTKLTKSRKIGLLSALLLVSSYIGIQATTWPGVHINYIDLIFVMLTSYRFLIYLFSNTKKNFIFFLL